MDWNTATKMERIQMVCEEGIEYNNKRILRFEEGTHMHSYILGMIGAFEATLSHINDGDDGIRGEDKQFYVCDPKKNTECTKTICIHSPKAIGPFCSHTLKKECEVDTPTRINSDINIA